MLPGVITPNDLSIRKSTSTQSGVRIVNPGVANGDRQSGAVVTASRSCGVHQGDALCKVSVKDLVILNRKHIRVVYQSLKPLQGYLSRKTENVFEHIGYMNLPGVQGIDYLLLPPFNTLLQRLPNPHILNVLTPAKGGRLAEIHNHACCCFSISEILEYRLCVTYFFVPGKSLYFFQ